MNGGEGGGEGNTSSVVVLDYLCYELKKEIV